MNSNETQSHEHLLGQLVQCQFLIGLVVRIKVDIQNTQLIEVQWCNSDLADKRGEYLPDIVQDWREQYLKYRGEIHE